VHTKHEFLPPEPILRFSQRTIPILYFRSKTHVWGGFALYRCRTLPIPKTGVGVHTKHEFLPPETFLCFSQRTCPIHYFRSKTHVCGGFAKFRCTSPIPKTGVRCIQSMSFRHWNHFFVINNEHAQSTTLGPKLMCGVVSRNLVVVRHPFPKRVSGCIQSTSFCHRNQFFFFSQRTCPILYFRSKTHVWGCFALYHCRTSPISKTGVGVHRKHEFLPPEPFLRFLQRACPIHYFRSKFYVWGGFALFRCRTSPIPKTGVGCIQSTSFRHWNHFFVFCNEHAQSTTLGPKLMFGVVSRNFVAARHPFRKRVSGAYKERVFATGTISSFFATNMPNPLL
jgi:hypothetical protein